MSMVRYEHLVAVCSPERSIDAPCQAQAAGGRGSTDYWQIECEEKPKLQTK